jgi:hypothetical protein
MYHGVLSHRNKLIKTQLGTWTLELKLRLLKFELWKLLLPTSWKWRWWQTSTTEDARQQPQEKSNVVNERRRTTTGKTINVADQCHLPVFLDIPPPEFFFDVPRLSDNFGDKVVLWCWRRNTHQTKDRDGREKRAKPCRFTTTTTTTMSRTFFDGEPIPDIIEGDIIEGDIMD